jgi:hypothetical protein
MRSRSAWPVIGLPPECWSGRTHKMAVGGLAPKVGPAGLTLCGLVGLAPNVGPAGLTLCGTGEAGGGRHRGPEVGRWHVA